MRASEGWYIRHHDKRQHGPFDSDRLLEAARVGHVASDQFLTFKQQVQQIHDRSELVVRNVHQP